jgi:REP element-mobilizing transposase RayT
MPSSYLIDKQEATYFLTPTVVEWASIFLDDSYKQKICDSLNYCIEKKGLEIFAYVIMSTHMHMIARAKQKNLSNLIRDFKKFTGGTITWELQKLLTKDPVRMEDYAEILEIFKTGGRKQKKKSKMQLWQYNNHAEEVYSSKFTLSKIRYIHNNPVEAGLVYRPEQYYFSSAMDYAVKKGPVKVTLLNLHSLM